MLRKSEMRFKETFMFWNWMMMMKRKESGKRSIVKSARLVTT